MRVRPGRGAMLFLAMSLLGACADRSTTDPGSSFGKQMTSAAVRVARMEARQHAAPGSLCDEEVITLGYQERLRLELGSLFRLMDRALRDPRLSREARADASSPVDEGGRREWWEGAENADLAGAQCAAFRTEG